MTIVASGEISLGGNATATRSVACELSRSGTSAICMDESAVRTLAARTTAGSAICMNDFYGKSNVPTSQGQAFGGGYFVATCYIDCNAYYLIVAPNATGCACCQWKTANSSTGNLNNTCCNQDNGYWNTFTYLNNADHPAGNWTATRSIGGFSDWYLPAVNETLILYRFQSCLPAGEGYSTAAANCAYNSSTEGGFGPNPPVSNSARCFDIGFFQVFYKTTTVRLRATRRVGHTPAAPTAFGQCYGGGFYTGFITSPANYYLIVAPNATGCAFGCRWKTATTLTNNSSNSTCNLNNGYWNTFTYLNNADHPAGNWAATRTIGGFSDWYLPSINEINPLYTNRNSMPTGERYVTAGSSRRFWSSTESTATFACYFDFSTGTFQNSYKTSSTNMFRVVRRCPA